MFIMPLHVIEAIRCETNCNQEHVIEFDNTLKESLNKIWHVVSTVSADG